MADLGQYEAIRDLRISENVRLNRVRSMPEYKELQIKARKLRQFIGGNFGVMDTSQAEQELEHILGKMRNLRS